jgi:hypothetical protein
MDIFEYLAPRFVRDDGKMNDTAFLMKEEFLTLLNNHKKSIDAHNELIKFVIETLTYKLGIEFDKLKLEREPYPYLNKETNKRELIYPLVLTLFNHGEKVLIMDGGETGVITHDLTLLFDKLLTMNMMQASGRPIIDFSLLVNVGFPC